LIRDISLRLPGAPLSLPVGFPHLFLRQIAQVLGTSPSLLLLPGLSPAFITAVGLSPVAAQTQREQLATTPAFDRQN
jgi:hypothetical protein